MSDPSPDPQPPRIPSVIEAVAQVMAEVQAVGKDGVNAKQGYRFRGVDAVVNAVGPALRRHGVVVMPLAESAEYETYETKGGTAMKSCVVKVRFIFHGPAGDTMEATVYGESSDSGDKSTPKAHSVAYRTALLQALCIPTDEPDPDEQSHERVTYSERQGPSPAELAEIDATIEAARALHGRIAALPADQRPGNWCEENGIPRQTQAMSLAQIKAVHAYLDAQIAPTPPQPPQVPDDAASEAQNGAQALTGALAGPLEAAAKREALPPELVEECIAQVRALNLRELDSQLKKRNLPVDGSEPDKRIRLTQALMDAEVELLVGKP